MILEEMVADVREILGDELQEIRVERAVFGLFYSGVKLSTGHGGLCFTPVKDMPEAVCCPSSAKVMPLSGRLGDRPVEDYLKDIFSGNVLRRTLGIAALNALGQIAWEKKPTPGFELISDANAFDLLEPKDFSKTVVIGALAPMLKKLIAAEADFRILEMDPRTLKEREMPYYLPTDRADECVPEADLLVITGVTLLNGTLDGLLEMARPDAEILITGPTVGTFPKILAKHGVTMLGGVEVTRPDELLNLLSEAGSGYHFFGKYALRTVVRKKGTSEK